jgi:antimicrobial peptide system SdpA family protein
MRPPVIMGVAYACVLIVAAIASVAATLPSNIMWERNQLRAIRVELNTIAAQDFAFFTRSAETEQIIAYRLNSDGSAVASLSRTPQAKASNLFGLSRTQRAQGPELANLVRAVRPGAWVNCTGLDRKTCFDGVPRQPKAFLHNNSPIPTVCGQVMLTFERTTKWAYRRLTDARYAVERVALASIDCVHGH